VVKEDYEGIYMTPGDILEKLKSNATDRVSKTLDAIYAVCQEQMDQGVADFSYSSISRLGEGRGVPRAQTIRNKTGEPYQALIKSFAECTTNVGSRRRRTKADTWIHEIKDPKLKLLVSIQESELIEAKRLVREIVPPDTTIVVDDRKGGLVDHRLSDSEQRALQFLVSEEFLSEWKLSVGKRGDVVDSNNNRVFKPGTLDAIKKALKYL